MHDASSNSSETSSASQVEDCEGSVGHGGGPNRREWPHTNSLSMSSHRPQITFDRTMQCNDVHQKCIAQYETVMIGGLLNFPTFACKRKPMMSCSRIHSAPLNRF